MRSDRDSGALVCVVDAIAPEVRPAHRDRVRRLFQHAAIERHKVSDGYAFRFPPGEIEEIARFVTHERTCCPFLEFSLDVPAQDGQVWLVITGPRGAQKFIESELMQ